MTDQERRDIIRGLEVSIEKLDQFIEREPERERELRARQRELASKIQKLRGERAA